MSCDNIKPLKKFECFEEFGPEHVAADMFSKAIHSLADLNEAIRSGQFRVFVDEHEVENVSVNDRGHISFNFKENVSAEG